MKEKNKKHATWELLITYMAEIQLLTQAQLLDKKSFKVSSNQLVTLRCK